ncbi:hypothetical protein [Streptomyces sp. NPDC000983]|uniref:hypothetical protein n=1 Tax=Streptomyces sp. NPDC000983 TaxID=3154373 RepID=UPI0033198E6B
MADDTQLREHLAGLAESGRRTASPRAAELVRARGEQRARRKRAAAVSGGVLLAAAVAVAGLSLDPTPQDPPPAGVPTPTASRFVPPAPAPGEEYSTELGYVYGAVVRGDTVRVTVRPLTGAAHPLVLSRGLLVEARNLSGGKPRDLELGTLVDQLAAGPRWVFAVDYDSEGRVQSMREAYWLDR